MAETTTEDAGAPLRGKCIFRPTGAVLSVTLAVANQRGPRRIFGGRRQNYRRLIKNRRRLPNFLRKYGRVEVTSRSGSAAVRFCLTAHWAARSTKRAHRQPNNISALCEQRFGQSDSAGAPGEAYSYLSITLRPDSLRPRIIAIPREGARAEVWVLVGATARTASAHRPLRLRDPMRPARKFKSPPPTPCRLGVRGNMGTAPRGEPGCGASKTRNAYAI